MKKTNAARILDQLNVVYEIRNYEVDPDHLGAEYVAGKIGMPIEQVFKTLVIRGDKTGILLACIPGGEEVDLKALAVISNNKKVELTPMKEIQALTGYIRGGVSPLGTKKQYPVYMHQSAFRFERIVISAGVRGFQLLLNPRDLCQATNAKVGQLTRQRLEGGN